ncbi:hypothetical protein GCM10009787_32960 [Streptomyces bangladeshensis]|uniref:Uncharacterized protein n=1 Tax=Streptomyces bangladeshensis TaxID=295352 RepID=A0ABN3BJS5_9ACTN
MSSLNDSASFVSEEFAARGLQPTFARSSLTSFSTSASATASRDTVTGEEAGAGAPVAVRDGVLLGFAGAEGSAVAEGLAGTAGSVVVEGLAGTAGLAGVAGSAGVVFGAGFLAGVFDGTGVRDASFEAEAEAEAEGEAEADGLAGLVRSLPPPVGAVAVLPVPPEVPPCATAVLLGEPAVCTRSPPVVRVPPPSW